MTTILLADDDRVVLFTLAEGLRAAGYDVLTAQEGERALALCQQAPIDLALLDIRMPGLDGLELARRLREFSAIPVLFLTAYDDLDLVRQAAESGALGYLVKPLSVAGILPMLSVAQARAGDVRDLGILNQGLQDAVHSNRLIGAAVGMVMTQERLSRSAAFEHLRKQARDAGRLLVEVAREKVDGDIRNGPMSGESASCKSN